MADFDPNIGKKLGDRYELLSVIGYGGMAVVYKAKDHLLNRSVAVKVLRSEYGEDEGFRRRFHAESRAIAMLQHQNIVSVYDVSGEKSKTEYIVMEMLDGITLKQYMEKRKKLSAGEVVYIVKQILEGLEHAHSRGIVHRDIKPQNIMILKTQGSGNVKITDFGIASLTDKTSTLENEAIGSVHYVSPEQARGERVTAQSDIYSLGIVLYEMLTGHLPFVGENAVTVAVQRITSTPLEPHEYDPSIPPALERICMKAMATRPENRYESASEMLKALSSYAGGADAGFDAMRGERKEQQKDEEPMEAFSPEKSRNVSRPAPKNAARKRREEEEDDEEEVLTTLPPTPGERRKRTLAVIGIVLVAVLAVALVGKLLFSSFENGGDTYAVPKVVGMTEEEAAEAEGVKGIFNIKVVGSRSSMEYEQGIIIEQDPDRGSRRKLGSDIEVYISTGVDSDEMPNLVGEDYQAARVKLLNMNLDLQIVEPDSVYSTEVPAGKIVSTIPEAGETLAKGNSVYIVISLGEEPVPVTVISFIGETEKAAREAAEELGLIVGESTVQESADAAEGQVTDQSIAVGSVVDSGTEIRFTVSGGPPAGSVTRRYSLPWWSEENVHVEIECNDEKVYDETVSSSMGSVTQTFTGKGTAHVKVYFDGVLTEEEDITLS